MKLYCTYRSWTQNILVPRQLFTHRNDFLCQETVSLIQQQNHSFPRPRITFSWHKTFFFPCCKKKILVVRKEKSFVIISRKYILGIRTNFYRRLFPRIYSPSTLQLTAALKYIFGREQKCLSP